MPRRFLSSAANLRIGGEIVFFDDFRSRKCSVDFDLIERLVNQRMVSSVWMTVDLSERFCLALASQAGRVCAVPGQCSYSGAGDCVSTTAFRTVHGAVGILQQRLRITAVLRVKADAEAGAHLQIFTIDQQAVLQ